MSKSNTKAIKANEVKKVKEVKYEALTERYRCRECKWLKEGKCETTQISSYTGEFNLSIGNPLDCPKRFRLIKLLLNLAAIIVIYDIFRKTLYTTNWIMLSILALAVSMAVMDFIFVLGNKVIRGIFSKFEKRRWKKYEAYQKQQEEKNRLEEAEKAKQEARFEEVNKAKNLKEKFMELAKVEKDEQEEIRISNPFKGQEYKGFLQALSELCDTIIPESFLRVDVADVFQMHLPEFFKISKSILKRYQDEVLVPRDSENYLRLAKNFTARLQRLQVRLEEQNMPSLHARMQELDSLLETKEGEE